MALTNIESLGTGNFFVQEAFKTLRTNISFCGDDIRTIAVTSSFANEGKSEVALRLAYAFAETGAKVILVDADIRNSVLAGPSTPNPAELLGKERFSKLIKSLSERYDFVIVDCPPILPVIDAAIVAKVCDAAIMVIAQNAVKKSDAKKALDQLSLSGTRMLGTVLNKVEQQGTGYGKYGKYGYGKVD